MTERIAWYGLNGWHGLTWHEVRVVGETPKRWRVRNHTTETLRLAGKGRWLVPGAEVLIPKGAVRFEAPVRER